MTDAVDRLLPGLRVGERVTLQARIEGADTEVIGFVVALDDRAVGVQDRRGDVHPVPRDAIVAARRVGVALGRDPRRAPRSLLDALARRAGASGTAYVARISDLLAGQDPAARVPEWGDTAVFDGVLARHENEWVTLADATPDVARAAAWWATRMGARSVQVRTDDPRIADVLLAAGFRTPTGA